MKQIRDFSRSHRGSLIIESVVAVALLATALVALGNLAAASAALGRSADQRLAATLAAENALERLRVVPFDQLTRSAATIGKAIQDSPAYDLQVETSEFRAGGRDAIHLVVTVRPSANVFITLHDWRIGPPPSASGGEGDASSE